MMEGVVTQIINGVSKKILKLLQENIKEYTYNSHAPNKFYFDGNKRPTGEFLNAWNWKPIEKNIQGVVRALYYNWQSMSVNEGAYKHSSVSANWPIDTRMQLADYLNVDGHDSSLWISVERKPYWEITIEDLFDKGLLNRWFDEESKKFGLIKK